MEKVISPPEQFLPSLHQAIAKLVGVSTPMSPPGLLLQTDKSHCQGRRILVPELPGLWHHSDLWHSGATLTSPTDHLHVEK